MGLPSAVTPSKVYFAPPPSATIVRVRLVGAGPGKNLDFATLRFQVPRKGLVCANKGPEATADKTRIDRTSGKRFIRFLLGLARARVSGASERLAEYEHIRSRMASARCS